MECYYHYDRMEGLRIGGVIEPEPYRVEESGLMLLGRCLDAGFAAHLAELMREGISLHGAVYLMMGGRRPDHLSMMTELAYEEHRWRMGVQAPSRLQSLFAWRYLEDAVRFGQEAGGGRIYRVRCHETEKPLPRDMNGLRLSYDPEEQERYAAMYWAGKPLRGDADYKPRWEYLLRLPVTVVEEVRVNPLEAPGR